MNEQQAEKPAQKRVNTQLIAGVVAIILAAFVLVFAVTATGGISPAATAGDAAPVATEQAATVVSGQTSTQVVAAGSAIAASAEDTVSEVIDDEANPLGAYPFENPLDGFTWVLLAAIAGATVFFILSTRRMNEDIARMRSSIR